MPFTLIFSPNVAKESLASNNWLMIFSSLAALFSALSAADMNTAIFSPKSLSSFSFPTTISRALAKYIPSNSMSSIAKSSLSFNNVTLFTVPFSSKVNVMLGLISTSTYANSPSPFGFPSPV